MLFCQEECCELIIVKVEIKVTNRPIPFGEIWNTQFVELDQHTIEAIMFGQ